MSEETPFPVVTRQLARDIAGFPTEVVLQVFDDRLLVLISQGKIGRLLQVTPPATDTRRRRAFDEHDGHNDDEQQGQTPLTVHPTLSSVYLPPPDPSSTISTVFGTARTDASDQTDHLYASQVAAILFARARSDVGGDDEQNEDVGESRQILGQGKPVIVGLGLKPSFVEAGDGSIDQGRERFAGVMKMVGDAVALLRG